MPENPDDDVSFADSLEKATPELLIQSEEQNRVTLRVEPNGDNSPPAEVSAAQLNTPSQKIEIGYSINPGDYSRKNFVRTGWSYFYFYIFLIIFTFALLAFLSRMFR